jgi:hypothetical protein
LIINNDVVFVDKFPSASELESILQDYQKDDY